MSSSAEMTHLLHLESVIEIMWISLFVKRGAEIFFCFIFIHSVLFSENENVFKDFLKIVTHNDFLCSHMADFILSSPISGSC